MKRITKNRNHLRALRHARIRAVVKGTKEIPRLSVFRGSHIIEAQLINDEAQKTICAAKTTEIKKEKNISEERKAKVALAYEVGKLIAEKAQKAGVKKAVFDRSGYKYHGRVQAVAEGARDGGLVF